MKEDVTQSSNRDTQYSPSVGDWVYISSHRSHGRIVERAVLWGHEIFRVWLPSSDTIVRVSGYEISTQHSVLSTHYLTYLAAAARVADALTQDLSACGDAPACLLYTSPSPRDS